MNSLSVPKENEMMEEQVIAEEIQRMMDAYGNDVLRTAYMYLKDEQKAEDAFQEVFIKVFNKYGSFKGESSEKTWIIRITINVCKDMLRSSWFRRVLLTDEIRPQNGGSNIEDKVIKNDENRLLFNAVISLPTNQKDVIILYYYQNYSTKEICEILNIAEGTVRSRLHRARKILKSKLEGRLDIDD